MANIKVKGMGVIHCENDIGKKIKRDWENNALKGMVKVSDRITIIASDIAGIEIEGDVNENLNDNVVKEDYKNFLIERMVKLEMTAIERARQIGFFELVYWGATGEKNAPEDVQNKAIAIQEKFFTENPKRCVCSAFMFKKIIPNSNTSFSKSMLPIIERIENRDKAESEK